MKLKELTESDAAFVCNDCKEEAVSLNQFM